MLTVFSKTVNVQSFINRDEPVAEGRQNTQYDDRSTRLFVIVFPLMSRRAASNTPSIAYL